MELKDYREELINDIKAESLEESIHEEVIFINKINDILLHSYSLINQELDTDCFLAQTPGNRAFKSMKLNAASLDVVTNTLNLAICNYNPGEIEKENLEQINLAASRMRAFCENTFKGYYSNNVEESLPVVQLARGLLRHLQYINKVHMFYITTNELGRNVKFTDQEPIVFSGQKIDVIYDIVDIEKIYNAMLPTFEKEDIEIDVTEYNTCIPCIKANIESQDYESYLAIVPGQFLADIYNKYGPRLLEDNVRSFLNVRGAVNKGIRGTILNEKDKFFTYNNGISTTAKEIELDNIDDKGLCITHFKGLQIINGGQTTASLANAMIKDKADLSGIYVQMKLTLTKEENPELVSLISKYANSQNKVTNADLNSNHPFYKRIEDFSTGAKKVMAPAVNGNVNQTSWFFERVRGQYDQPKMKMTKAEWDKFTRINPKNQKFTKTDLAKYINTFDMLPHLVSWGADVNAGKFQERISAKWDKDNTVFNEEYFKDLVSKAIMFKHVEKLISHEEWYMENKAYRAALVTYTLAKFEQCVEDNKKGMNFKAIWLKQEVPAFLDVDLSKIAKMCFDVFYDDHRPVTNIGEYAKREVCWNTIKQLKYDLTEKTYNFLLSKEEIKEEQRKAKKEQIQSNNITTEIEIFNKGKDYWNSLMTRGRDQNVISYNEQKLLLLATDFCDYKKVRSLSNFQTKQIENVVKKLKEFGIE